MKFANQIAIVTASAGAGIGQATARALAQEGATVIVSDHNEKRTLAVAEQIAKDCKAKTVPIVCDVTNKQQVMDLVKQVIDKFGRIDHLVNNAAFENFQPLHEMEFDTLDRIFNICLLGTAYVAKAVLPHMIKQKKGHIVNMSSIAGFSADVGSSAAYSAAKAGVAGFTWTLAHEVGKHNIKVNGIAPFMVPNPFLAKVQPQEQIDEMVKRMPLGAITPQAIAKLILFLLSDEVPYLSGETIKVTSGW